MTRVKKIRDGNWTESGTPNAKREVIRKAGHLIPLEPPEVFNITVLAFFRKHGLL